MGYLSSTKYQASSIKGQLDLLIPKVEWSNTYLASTSPNERVYDPFHCSCDKRVSILKNDSSLHEKPYHKQDMYACCEVGCWLATSLLLLGKLEQLLKKSVESYIYVVQEESYTVVPYFSTRVRRHFSLNHLVKCQCHLFATRHVHCT